MLFICKLVNTNKDLKLKEGVKSKGTGRIQWDPERDLFQSEKKEPRKMLRRRAIQIGLSGILSEWYVDNIVSIEEVTSLAQKVQSAHALKKLGSTESIMESMKADLPKERPYLPALSQKKLESLAMLPGLASNLVVQIGKGKFKTEK